MEMRDLRLAKYWLANEKSCMLEFCSLQSM